MTLSQRTDSLCPTRALTLAGMNSARAFMRREDYAPRRTPTVSPFRIFNVQCLKCDSYQLRVTAEFDEDAGEVRLVLVCVRCRQQEKVGAG